MFKLKFSSKGRDKICSAHLAASYDNQAKSIADKSYFRS